MLPSPSSLIPMLGYSALRSIRKSTNAGLDPEKVPRLSTRTQLREDQGAATVKEWVTSHPKKTCGGEQHTTGTTSSIAEQGNSVAHYRFRSASSDLLRTS